MREAAPPTSCPCVAAATGREPHDDRRPGSRGGWRSSRSVRRSPRDWRATLPAWPIFGSRNPPRESGRLFQLIDDGKERAVGVVRRAEIPQDDCGISRKPLLQTRAAGATCQFPVRRRSTRSVRGRPSPAPSGATAIRVLRHDRPAATAPARAAPGSGLRWHLHRSLARLRSVVRNPLPVPAQSACVRKVHEPVAACWRQSTRHRLERAKAAPPPGSTARPMRPVTAARSRRDPRPRRAAGNPDTRSQGVHRRRREASTLPR